MIKTQIQMPEYLYRELKRVAREREMTMAELARRGLENVLCLFSPHPEPRGAWELPKPRMLGGDAFFDNPDWRYELNRSGGAVREGRADYRTSRKRKRK
jgi:hypothetical protein